MNFRILAFGVSVLCHPLLLPTFVCVVCFYVVSLRSFLLPESQKIFWVALIFMMTFGVPMLGILLYYFLGTIKSLMMDSRQDRFFPFVLTTCIYGMSTWLLVYDVRIAYLPLLVWFLGGVTVTLAIITVITFYWKVSAHSAGIMGIVGLWFGLACHSQEVILLYLAVVTILIAGLLMTARLYLNAHNIRQISVGGGVGFVINFLSAFIATW